MRSRYPKTIRSTGADVTVYIGDEDFITEGYYAWHRKNEFVEDIARQHASVALAKGKSVREAAVIHKKAAAAAGRMSGAFGYVYKLRVRDQNYIIKSVILNPDKYARNRSMTLNELMIAIKLTILAPDAVSNLIGAVFIDNKAKQMLQLYLMYEGPDGYDLRTYINRGISPANMNRLYCLIKSVQKQVNDAGYVHRDIKPENIFVQENPLRCKLIDMGLVVPIGVTVGIAGTPDYMPEYMVDVNAAGEVHLRENRYKAETGGKANVRHNNHSVDTIWTLDFGQTGPLPDCRDRFQMAINNANAEEAAALVAGLPNIPLPTAPVYTVPLPPLVRPPIPLPAAAAANAAHTGRPPLAPLFAPARTRGFISPVAYRLPPLKRPGKGGHYRKTCRLRRLKNDCVN